MTGFSIDPGHHSTYMTGPSILVFHRFYHKLQILI
jgi:hypothetical protein